MAATMRPDRYVVIDDDDNPHTLNVGPFTNYRDVIQPESAGRMLNRPTLVLPVEFTTPHEDVVGFDLM